MAKYPATTEDAPEVPTPRAPLSKVMLAMDVVDTLRHHRALVASELNEEARERGLIERVKGIYESQGIDVPDDVIRKGVEGLKADRFTYKPAERTLAVRLAEIYVRRGTWAKRALAVLAVAGMIWGGFAYANHKKNKAYIQAFTARLHEEDATRAELDRRVGRIQALLDEPAESDPEIVRQIHEKALAGLVHAREHLATWDQARTTLAPDEYPESRADFDRALDVRRESLNAHDGHVSRLLGNVQTIHQLRSVGSEIGRTLAIATSMAVPPKLQPEVGRLLSSAREALDAGEPSEAKSRLTELTKLLNTVRHLAQTKRSLESGLASQITRLNGMPLDDQTRAETNELQSHVQANIDAETFEFASSHLQELTWLTTVLDQAYRMEIVSRPDERSGVWRHPRNQPRVRNYYIVVEILGANGRPMPVEFRSDEDQELRRASRVAVRVPESVYEAVKADKLDNGIVDTKFFGRKERGKRSPTYAFETAGGWIADW